MRSGRRELRLLMRIGREGRRVVEEDVYVEGEVGVYIEI